MRFTNFIIPKVAKAKIKVLAEVRKKVVCAEGVFHFILAFLPRFSAAFYILYHNGNQIARIFLMAVIFSDGTYLGNLRVFPDGTLNVLP